MMHKRIFQTILSACKGYWLALALRLILDSSQIFTGSYTFVAFQRLLDGLPLAHRLTDLAPVLAVYIGVNLLNHTLVYVEGIPATRLSRGVYQQVKLIALDKISRVDFLAYQELGTGNLIQIIENGSEAVRKILTDFYFSNFLGLVQILISLYFIRFYDPTLFVVVLVLFGFFLLVSNTLMRYLRDILEKMLSNQENFSKFSVRAFMELVVFRVNGRFKAEYERIQGISDEIVRTRVKVFLLQELSYTGFAFLIFIIEAVVVIQQAGKIIDHTSTVGTLAALVSFIGWVFWPVIGLGRSWMEYRLNVVTYTHLDRVLSLPDDPGFKQAAPLAVKSGAIEFNHVSFGYKEKLVLRDFTLMIEMGKTTALVGASGGGKSTFVRLLLQLIKPDLGQVLVDHQDLAKVNLASYYRELAYIPQEPPIFDGTLRENLTFDRPADPDRLAEALRKAGLEEMVQKLPKGLETVVGERGIKLSGGERQRLAFGRVLLQDPKIVIMDEPTSALDSVTEDDVTRAMASFLKGRTVIIVAHRLQSVKNADQIIVLDHGQIVQRGKFDQLVSAAGKFRQLWEKQTEKKMIGDSV